MFLYINSYDFLSTSLLSDVEKKIKDFLNASHSSDGCARNIIFINHIQENDCTQKSNFTQLANRLYRKYFLHRNEQETIVSWGQQMVVIQIILHQLQMEPMSILEVQRICEHITEIKLNNGIKNCYEGFCSDTELEVDELLLIKESEESTKLKKIAEIYNLFLKNSNVVDFSDLMILLDNEISRNSELRMLFDCLEDVFVLIRSRDLSYIERMIATHMLKRRDCYELTISIPLDSSFSENFPLNQLSIDIARCSKEHLIHKLKTADELMSSGHKIQVGNSLSKTYAEHLLLSYLTLLVNSRSELALATIINIPDRGIDHHSFTRIKHVAASKNLSMYQTIISFVLKTRLGGKGHAPGSDDPFYPFVKGLTEFTDLFNNLHSVIEEDSDVKSAILRLVKMIKNVVCKQSSSSSSSFATHQPLKRDVVEEASSQIISTFYRQMEMLDEVDLDGITPTRLINEGASIDGRRTLRMIRNVLDFYATTDHQQFANDQGGILVADTVLTQSGRTPMRVLPSLASKFKTPEEINIKQINDSDRPLPSGQNVDQGNEFILRSGLKRHQSTPTGRSSTKRKPKPLFCKPFSSPSSNKENIPPGHEVAPKPPRKQTEKQRKPAAKKGHKKIIHVDPKTQPTIRQFFS